MQWTIMGNRDQSTSIFIVFGLDNLKSMIIFSSSQCSSEVRMIWWAFYRLAYQSVNMTGAVDHNCDVRAFYIASVV